MRWIILSVFLMAYTPIHLEHGNKKVDDEFKNIEANLQDQQFTIYSSTPILSAVKDGQIFIVFGGSHTIYSALMWRRGREIYKVNGSCITVVR